MKRFAVTLLLLLFLLAFAGCNRITINYKGNATLNFSGNSLGDTTDLTQILTEEETEKVEAYLSSAEYVPGGVACPFDSETSITFGEQIFAISTDDCPTVLLVGSNQYYRMSEEGRNYIVSLFEKYVGYFPYP